VPLRALHRLYEIAESNHITEQEVHPYESDVDFSITPKGQYVLMLLMADLAERDLPPLQRLVAQHWLAGWARDVTLEPTWVYGKHSMLVNLDSDEGIQRIAESSVPTNRYLDIRAIARHIEKMDAHLANSNHNDESTKDIGEATEADLAQTLGWLEKLYHDRSSAFKITRERKPSVVDRFARVVIGWNLIHDFLDASNWGAKTGRGTFSAKCPSARALGAAAEAMALARDDSTLLDQHFRTGTEHRDAENFLLWKISDLSVGGLGLASVDSTDAELPVGTLMMVAIEGESAWSLARIVRKFKGLDEKDTRFGIQVIGLDAVPVHLIPRPPDDQVTNTLIQTVTGLFLCRPEQPNQQDLMLVSSSALAHTRRFELKSGTKRLPIRATLAMQSAGAWVMIQFEEDV
jgi:hypothetical protein